jgi:hypothetical protein
METVRTSQSRPHHAMGRIARMIHREGVGAAALLAAGASSMSAQNPVTTAAIAGVAAAMTETTRQYGGTISWSWTEGDGSEQAQLRVTQGVVECSGTWRSGSESGALQGQGKLDVKVGLGNNDMHQIWAACPLANGDGQFHEMDSYKQPGGTVGLDRKTSRAILPDTLKGSWTGEFGDGTGTMTWLLCLKCTPPPAAP